MQLTAPAVATKQKVATVACVCLMLTKVAQMPAAAAAATVFRAVTSCRNYKIRPKGYDNFVKHCSDIKWNQIKILFMDRFSNNDYNNNYNKNNNDDPIKSRK